jgi:hypothetical protein
MVGGLAIPTAETHQVMKNIQGVLASQGLSFDHVVKGRDLRGEHEGLPRDQQGLCLLFLRQLPRPCFVEVSGMALNAKVGSTSLHTKDDMNGTMLSREARSPFSGCCGGTPSSTWDVYRPVAVGTCRRRCLPSHRGNVRRIVVVMDRNIY